MDHSKKHPYINWVDGMKISRAHFNGLENSLLEDIFRGASVHLTDHDFGLLPLPQSRMEDSFGLEVNSERIEVYRCLAITRNGIQIAIDNDQVPGLVRSIQELARDQQLSREEAWYVVLRVDPFDKQVSGEPDVDEEPLRHPNSLPTYQLELVPSNMIGGIAFLQGSLPLARILISNEQGNRVDESYIPPARSMRATRNLFNRYKEIEKDIIDIDHALIDVIKTAKYKLIQGKNTSISDDLLEIARHLSQYITNNIDDYTHILKDRSPFYWYMWFLKMARAMSGSYRFLRDKDHTFNYCEKFSRQEASFLEEGVKKILGLSYDHLNVRPLVDSISHWVHELKELFQTLAELSYNDLGEGGIITSGPDQRSNPFAISRKSKSANPRKRGESREGEDWFS